MMIFQRYFNWRRNAKLSFEEDVLKLSLLRATVLLFVIISVHVYLMGVFEGFSWQDGLWLTFTTLSTTGYGDISASTSEGKIATVLLLYLGGIFILAKTAGDYFEYRASIRFKKIRGFWKWSMSNHILIINTPSQQGEQFFVRLLKNLHNSGMQGHTVQILTTRFPDGLPSRLSKMSGLIHYTGSGTNYDDLQAVNVEQAKYIRLVL
ncbi:MAG: potassium channel family protein [Methylococcales bacterium]|nr:potassium channel family protein [Methylococcales bacterium]